MKRILCLVLAFAFLLLCACGGDVSGTEVEIVDSIMFSEKEIYDAADVVMDFFKDEMDGCTLNTLTYNERFSANEALEWAEHYKAEQAIILYSNFDTDPQKSSPTLEPGANYAWKWILTRSGPDKWKLQNWGYG